MSSCAGIFFLSTGRCGTQWLQRALAATYPDEAVVTHEPIRGPYEPRVYLRAYDRLGELLSSEAVSRHLANISETLKSKTYIETGWPCYPALPLIAERLGGRMKIVHLVRHPVYTALSLAPHQHYIERQDWVAGAAISPFDRGVLQKELAGDWPGMTLYEKCLFWWTEINLYALELKERLAGVEFSFVRYEDLFEPDAQTLEGLTTFMGLAYRPSLSTLRSQHVDKHPWRLPAVDWQLVFRYPRTVALAERFGYRLNDLPTSQLEARYFSTRS